MVVALSLDAPLDCTVTDLGPQNLTISGLNVPTNLTLAVPVVCSQLGGHEFVGTANVAATDPDLIDSNLDNNSNSLVITRTVIWEADGAILSMDAWVLDRPSSIEVGEEVTLVVFAEATNLRLTSDDPTADVIFRTTINHVAPPGCTINSGNSRSAVSGVSLEVDKILSPWSASVIQCSTPGLHTFSFESVIEPRGEFFVDPNLLNNIGTFELTVRVITNEADLQLTDLQLHAVDPINVETPFDVFFDITVDLVENEFGPNPVDAEVSVSLTTPGDCIVTDPGTRTVTFNGLNAPINLAVPVQVICNQPGFHDFTGTASVALVDSDMVDLEPGNNSNSTAITSTVIWEADGAILSMDAFLLDRPSSIEVGELATVAVVFEISNVRLSPDDPTADVVFNITNNYAAPTGCTINGEGSRSESGGGASMEVDKILVSFAVPVIQCSTPGFHTFSFETVIAPRYEHFVDPNPLNDRGSFELTVRVGVEQVDTDGDGIADIVDSVDDGDGIDDILDTQPLVVSSNFGDKPLGGKTSGYIQNLSAGVSVAIADVLPNTADPITSKGVMVVVSGTSGNATIRIDGINAIFVLAAPGTYVLSDPVTTVTTEVIEGEAEIVFDIGSEQLVVVVEEGETATITETSVDGILQSIAVVAVVGDVTVNDVVVSDGDTQTFSTPRATRQLILDSLLDHEGESKRIDKAIKELRKSLKDKLWEDDSHLDPKHGKKVFDHGKHAIKELKKALEKDDLSPEAAEWVEMSIEDLIEAARTLAQIEIDEAANAPVLPEKEQQKVDKELARAEQEIAKGDNDRDNGKSDKATDHYKKAWEHVLKAIKKHG